jgi:hypothetical protein
MGSKRTYEYVAGREAFERFRNAVKAVLSVPKSALPQKTKKTAKKKASR